MYLSERFFSIYANSGVLSIITRLKIPVDWAIEAGCHDGTDTLKIASLPNMKLVYAFEPDKVAGAVAKEKFRDYKNLVKFSPKALWSKQGSVEMRSPSGNAGDGNSIFSFHEEINSILEDSENVLACTAIDAEILPVSNNGMLWLDVEGVPHIVLEGAKSTLDFISIAQIEVEMHKMSEYRGASFVKVHKIMKMANFELYRAPLHPGYFGDVIYIKRNKLSFVKIISSRILVIFMFALHGLIYPVLGKPRQH